MARNDPAQAKAYFAAKLAYTTGPVELDRMMKTEHDLRIVDVRAEADYRREHIPGSVNLPRERWPTLQGLEKDKLNVLLCYSQVCHLAASAAVGFADAGFSVMELEGGFKAWREHRLPVEGRNVRSDAAAAIGESKSELLSGLDELRGVRDELRVRIHLASLDAKDTMRALEGRLEGLEREIEGAADRAATHLREALADLQDGFRRLRDRLS